MFILSVDSKYNQPNPTLEIELCNNYTISTHHVEASMISAFTSVRIVAEVKRQKPDAVMVGRIKDAVAAISARQLLKADNAAYKIIMYVDYDLPLPHSIPAEVIAGVDCWIFNDQHTLKKWGKLIPQCARKELILPISMDEHIKTTVHDGRNLLWLGDITDRALLEAYIKAVADTDINLRIAGTGKARIAMPAVKLSRHSDAKTTWLGDSYDAEKELSEADALCLTQPERYTSLHARALASGIPVLRPEDIAAWTKGDDKYNRENTIERSKEFGNLHSLADQLLSIIK